MKRTIAFALAALLCLALAACGKDNPEPRPTEAVTETATKTAVAPTAKEVFNNGGRHVQHGGDMYYWEDWTACFEPSGIWGQFADVPGIRRSMMRLGADGKQEGLFIENGYGSIWIYQDRFYLTWLPDNYRQQIFSAAMERGDDTGDAVDRRELGPGEIFALDEARGLLIAMEDWHGALLTIDAETGKRAVLVDELADALLYDAASATLYYRDFSAIGERNVVRLRAVDVTTGKVRDIARIDSETLGNFEDADAVEFDNVWLEEDGLHVFMSGYSGTGRHFMGCAHLIVNLAGGGIEQYDAGDAPDYSRFAVNKPFDMREIQGYDDYYGWYIRNEKDELAHILTHEDVAPLGLPGGPYYTDDSFGDVGHVEYADGAAYFSIVSGPRNPEEDIGWREAYDLHSLHVYRKDLATGQTEKLYYFDPYS